MVRPDHPDGCQRHSVPRGAIDRSSVRETRRRVGAGRTEDAMSRTSTLRPLELALAAVAIALALVRVAAGAERATAPLALSLGAGSAVWLEGTSTMHDFECRTSEITLHFTRD